MYKKKLFVLAKQIFVHFYFAGRKQLNDYKARFFQDKDSTFFCKWENNWIPNAEISSNIIIRV